MRDYNLSAYSSVEYCKKDEEPPPLGEILISNSVILINTQLELNLDRLEILARNVIFVIIAFVLVSTFYDRHLKMNSLKSKVKIVDHYEAQLGSKMQRILTLFSIQRNWKTLIQPTRENVSDLHFIEALRILVTFGVIHNHCMLYATILPSANPMFIDEVNNFNWEKWRFLKFAMLCVEYFRENYELFHFHSFWLNQCRHFLS